MAAMAAMEGGAQAGAVAVRQIDAVRGRGLVAQRDFAADEVVFCERPMVACQYAYNKHEPRVDSLLILHAPYRCDGGSCLNVRGAGTQMFFPACSYCLRSLEPPVDMAVRLAGYEEPPVFFPPALERLVPRERLPCAHCDDEVYCSDGCRQSAWHDHHERLCMGRGDAAESHPLRLLLDAWKGIHYPPETATVFLLARILAILLRERRARGPGAPGFLGSFSDFAMDFRARDLEVQHKFLAAQFRDSLAILHQLMRAAFPEPELDDVFTEVGFSHIFCLMCLNSQGVGTSALDEYETQLGLLEDAHPDDSAIEDALAYLAEVQDDIEEHSAYGNPATRARQTVRRSSLANASGPQMQRGSCVVRAARQFTHAEGSALYRVHSAMNHACEPNAECRFTDSNAMVHVVATRPIRAGEEILLCYLDDAEHMPVSERRKMLLDYYLFECVCERCQRELAQEQALAGAAGRHRRPAAGKDGKGKRVLR